MTFLLGVCMQGKLLLKRHLTFTTMDVSIHIYIPFVYILQVINEQTFTLHRVRNNSIIFACAPKQEDIIFFVHIISI